jgi:hypothetical protein
MIGNANEKEIRNVALKLEQFREVFTRLFPNIRFNTPVPTTSSSSRATVLTRLSSPREHARLFPVW